MLIYIVKTNDIRYFYLYELLKEKYVCEYSDSYSLKQIKKIVLPLEGLDEFGYIKHTNLKLENLIQNNNIEKIYTGRVNNVLQRIAKINNIEIITFYDDLTYCKKEFEIKTDVIKTFLEEVMSTRFQDIKVLVIGSNYKAYLISEKLSCDIYDRGSISNKSIQEFLWKNYDAIINCSNHDLSICGEKYIIEMNELNDVDLSILLNCKKVYFINQLLTQYLTKSGGRILYDSMVNR